MNKSPDAFRTISEVAEQLDVPAHVLRFWETRFAQVKPIKRGGGRRYYRPDDVRLLRGIRGLLYDDGMTIKGVQKILREHGIRHVIALGTVDETQVTRPAPAPALTRTPAVPVEAEPVLATAGGDGTAPAPSRGAAGPADGTRREALVAASALDDNPGADGSAGADGTHILPSLARRVNREALQGLVAELEALRRVMAGRA